MTIATPHATTPSSADIRCPLCGAPSPKDRGTPRYRLPTKVAGEPIELRDLSIHHYICRRCTYEFTYPRIPQERLLACYQAASNGHWTTDESAADKRFYTRKKALLTRLAPGRRILDFGAFDGGFLQYLGPAWEKAGIEPATFAAKAAEARGVQIISPTIEQVDWSKYENYYDAVTIFDVMEHVPNPVAILRDIARLLRPGGVIMIETGNAGSFPWNIVGPRYWYCGIVEHIGFLNRKSLAVAAGKCGLDMPFFEPSVHTKIPLRWAFWAIIGTSGYWFLRLLTRLGVPLKGRLANVARGIMPGTPNMRDHFLAILQKPLATQP